MGPGCWGDLTSHCLASIPTSPFRDVEVWLTFVLATLTSDLGEAWGWEYCPRGMWGKEATALCSPGLVRVLLLGAFQCSTARWSDEELPPGVGWSGWDGTGGRAVVQTPVA